MNKISSIKKKIKEYGFLETLKIAINKLFGNNIYIERFLFYRNPKRYWEERGGDRYFADQESRRDRDLRSKFIAENLMTLNVRTVLEVGCGYGKQLKSIRELNKEIELVGIDFSFPQIKKSKEYLRDCNIKALICADARFLPFKDNSFDLVFTSAVILHNPPRSAKRIREEIFRVSKRYVAHNEDKSVTSTRWSYDYDKIYKMLDFEILKSCKIPHAPSPEITQFVIAKIKNVKNNS